MPPRGVEKGSKRARQYEHIKDSLEDRGESEDVAEEIAARTVNKERARHGESRTSSKLSKTNLRPVVAVASARMAEAVEDAPRRSSTRRRAATVSRVARR